MKLQRKLEYLSFFSELAALNSPGNLNKYKKLDYHSIIELRQKEIAEEHFRLESIKSIIDEWKKHSSDYTQRICTVDPAPLNKKTALWLDNPSYLALNKFFSKYSKEYRKRNNTFGAIRLFIAPDKFDHKTAQELAKIIDFHLDNQIEVGIVFLDNAKRLVDDMYFNCNVINKRMATDARGFEEDEKHSIVITDSKIEVQNFYENFRILDRNAIKFNSQSVPIYLRKLNCLEHRRITLPPYLKFYVFLRSGGRCAECKTDLNLQYDHVYPYSLGGSNAMDNFQILCGECNRKKINTV